ncbi:MAG TPA: methyltransferase domain-containing protein [Acidimicrobiia bacterium]|nr:methyltransferase domain-containing protein [Acidimicrobiia bacterium]
MSSPRVYDRIGRTYTASRRTDPRIAARIHAALGDARAVCNVGAGAGSYEPTDRHVVAVEPSAVMVAQRNADTAPVVRAVAEGLPFASGAFEAAMAVLTAHHWRDLGAGLAEMQRVAPRQVVFYFEPSWSQHAWIIHDYFPEVVDLPTERSAPGADEFRAHLDVRTIDPVPVPADCIDGFGAAFWNRPEAYLDPVVQQGMSFFAQLDDDALAEGTARLAADLESGEWDRRHGHLRDLDEYDCGYRLLVAGR